MTSVHDANDVNETGQDDFETTSAPAPRRSARRRDGNDAILPERPERRVGLFHSLHSKLMVSALVVIATLCATWFVLVDHFSGITESAAQLELTASEIRRQIADVRLIEQDIQRVDLSAPDIYAGKVTEHMERHDAAVERLQKLAGEFAGLISERSTIEDPSDLAELLPQLVREYELSFIGLLAAQRDLGREQWGEIGSLNDTAAEIGDTVDSIGNPMLGYAWMGVRVAEKDVVGRPGPYYDQRTSTVQSGINEVERTLRGIAEDDAAASRTLLADYKTSFDRVVALEKEIGLDDESGMRGQLAHTVNGIDSAAAAAARTAANVHDRAQESQTQASLLISLLGFVGTAGAFYFLAGSIARPISEVKDAALNVAAGNLDVRLTRNGHDEVGVLRDAFNRMTGALRGMNGQLREGASSVTASVAQLSSSTSEVSAASSETSAAMTEAVATIENVKDSVRVTTQRSKHVSHITQDAAGVAAEGKGAAQNSIDGIERIRVEMDDIAGSIMALNEQGQAIAEIISTVNDLAERSNLLAVNAAIEAAKAGDEGRGFVVVADEIKGLAEQSKRSTAEVRTILNKIQKDTAASVMAAERGRKAVEHGIRQATAAGEAILTLGSTIDDVAGDAHEISSAMQQVDASVNQVFTAMASVLAATQQNEGAIGEVDSAIKNLERTAQHLHERAVQHTA